MNEFIWNTSWSHLQSCETSWDMKYGTRQIEMQLKPSETALWKFIDFWFVCRWSWTCFSTFSWQMRCELCRLLGKLFQRILRDEAVVITRHLKSIPCGDLYATGCTKKYHFHQFGRTRNINKHLQSSNCCLMFCQLFYCKKIARLEFILLVD